MAHFCRLDSSNTVIQIIVVDNEKLLDEHGVEQEQKGIDFFKSIFGADTNWVQTSYNNNFRKQYAWGGGKYDPVNDVFIKPQPWPSWNLNSSFDWEAPVAYPTDNELYHWDEEQGNWIKD